MSETRDYAARLTNDVLHDAITAWVREPRGHDAMRAILIGALGGTYHPSPSLADRVRQLPGWGVWVLRDDVLSLLGEDVPEDLPGLREMLEAEP